MIKSWRTSLLGLCCIGVAIWSMSVTYVPIQPLRFNLLYVWSGQEALLLVGLGLLHARDHKA